MMLDLIQISRFLIDKTYYMRPLSSFSIKQKFVMSIYDLIDCSVMFVYIMHTTMLSDKSYIHLFLFQVYRSSFYFLLLNSKF